MLREKSIPFSLGKRFYNEDKNQAFPSRDWAAGMENKGEASNLSDSY